MLDRDLAELYQVPTKVMNLAVRRHADRFPADFMFQLTTTEWKILRFQFETSIPGAGGRRYVPHVFTEQGVAMLSSVLNSQRAVQVNIAVMRAFVRLREYAANYKGLGDRLAAMEREYDSKFKVVIDAIRGLLNPPLPRKRPIGFRIYGRP